MEDHRKRTIISAVLLLAVVASFVLLAVEVNSGGRHILTGIFGWAIQVATLSVLIHKHLNGRL